MYITFSWSCFYVVAYSWSCTFSKCKLVTFSWSCFYGVTSFWSCFYIVTSPWSATSSWSCGKKTTGKFERCRFLAPLDQNLVMMRLVGSHFSEKETRQFCRHRPPMKNRTPWNCIDLTATSTSSECRFDSRRHISREPSSCNGSPHSEQVFYPKTFRFKLPLLYFSSLLL